MLYTVVIILGFLALKIDGQSNNSKVALGVYYETLCPDSIAFINYQLYPTVQSLGIENIDLNLVPFGKASWTESGSSLTFTCQHGERECKGNTIQNCAKTKLDAGALVKFVHCMESSRSPDKAGPSCAQKGGFDFNAIDNCAKGSEGANLLKAAGVSTKSLTPAATFIPTITVNNERSSSIQERALTDLKGLLCDSFPASATKPSGCSN